MALAALQMYFEGRVAEAVESICHMEKASEAIAAFYRASLEADLKLFHCPSSDRVRQPIRKYLSLDVSDAWSWNNCDSAISTDSFLATRI